VEETTKDITKLWIKDMVKHIQTSYNYYLPENMYRYVLIPSGISVIMQQMVLLVVGRPFPKTLLISVIQIILSDFNARMEFIV
jgi:hypothetical protein